MEAIDSGVPMYVHYVGAICRTALTSISLRICWPQIGDQPVNTLHMTHNLDIAFELFEVRTGHGLRPVHRTGITHVGTVDAVRQEANDVLDKAFGGDGERKRANIQKLRESMSNAWSEQGPSRHALEHFLDGCTAS